MRHSPCVLGLLLVTLAAAPAPAETAPLLTPERIDAAPALSGPTPRALAFSPDGSKLTFLKPKADDPNTLDLWAYDVATGAPSLLLDARALNPGGVALSEAEKARRERLRITSGGVVSYTWDAEGRAVLVPLDGDLVYVDVTGPEPAVRRLTESAAFETDARLSPKGRYAGFVRDNALYSVEVATGGERMLSPPATETVSYGVAEFVAQEEMYRFTGYWWAPDDGAVAYTRVDESPVDVVERFDIGADGVTVVRQRYPAAGRPNAVVDLYIRDLEHDRVVEVDLGPDDDIYLARVDWLNAQTLIVQRQNRAQTKLDVLAVDRASGAAHLLFSETSPTWINLHNDFRPLAGGAQFLWSSERMGFRHLYLYAADGTLIRQVTAGDKPLREATRGGGAVAGVDEASGTVFVVGMLDDLLEEHLYAVDYRIDGAAPRRLTARGGSWSITMDKTARAFVGTYSDPAQPPRTGLYRADGSFVAWIEENRLDASHPYAPYLAAHVTPTFGEIPAADGTPLPYELYVPEGCSAARPCSAVQIVYGGPGVSSVSRGWGGFQAQLLTARGYVVFQLDNRGANGRGKAFEDPLHRRMAGVEVEDQLAGLAHLKSLPFVDESRVGVWGWSYGGYMVLHLLTQAPDAYAAGVAGAPVSDWALYDTHYTERYMGTLADNPDGYRHSDVLTHLPNLKSPLLLIHGMADDNVVFENSTRVMRALQTSNQPFETMLYPGERHGLTPRGPRAHGTNAWLTFFERHLKPEAE